MKNAKTSTILLLASITLALGILLGAVASRQNSQSKQAGYISNNKLNEIWNMVSSQYVDDISNDSLQDKMFAAMLSSLDPHSRYMTAEEMRREEENLRGNFEGIGLTLRIINDTVCVGQVLPGSPSSSSPIAAGDQILTVDDTVVSGVKRSLDKTVNIIRGPRGSAVSLEVLHYGNPEPARVTIRRDVIKTHSVVFNDMIDSETGMIKISQFDNTTAKEFHNALRDLNKRGMKRLVLDLRGNGGGLLSAAISVCNELLPKNKLIVYTKGEHQRRSDIRSHSGGLFTEGELMVLIDEFSASASEIVAGAVQDNDRGIIAGRRSFGKGLVQTQFPLSDNSAILLTTSRYYTPSGRCIQRPYDKGTDKYYADFVEQVASEYDNDTTPTRIADSTPYKTSTGRIVYGGGGICPDYIISITTDSTLIYFNKLANKGLFVKRASEIVAAQGNAIKQKHSSASYFAKQFSVSNKDLEAIFDEGVRKGIARDDKSINAHRVEMMTLLKAHIAEMLYSSEAFIKVELDADKDFQDALRYFNTHKISQMQNTSK